MPDILDDEQAALLWSGAPLTITADTKSAATGTTTDDDDDSEPPKVKTAEGDKILNQLFIDNPDEDNDNLEDADDTQDTATKTTQTTTEPKKAGRKTTDLVSTVTKLIEDGELFGFSDGDIKTNDEAIELLKLNLKEREKTAKDESFKEKINSYSPQIQAILHYAEQGAQSATELMQLMGAMKEMEDLYEFDISTSQGQEDVVRQYYKSKGFKDTYIEKQINLVKDAGGENLKEEAEAFLPELVSDNEKKIEKKMREQEENKKRAAEASKVYLSTVRETLNKDKMGEVPIKKEDKAKVFEAVANPKYTSIGGMQTTQFVKTLEELQFSQDKKDYDHFLNIVRYSIDPKGFLESLKATISNDVNAQTIKTLRTTKTTTPNSTVENDGENGNTGSARKTIKKDFVNPFV